MAGLSPQTPIDAGPPGSGITLTQAGIARGGRRIAPVAIMIVPFGVACGAAAIERGLSIAEALLMSATVFAGASQFAALELWRHPLPLLSIALVVLAVNARLIMLGAALAPWVNALPRWQRICALMFLTDANFADSYRAWRAGERDAGVLIGGGLAIWIAWIVGTAIGAVIGDVVSNLEQLGVDVVFAALFAAILVPELGRPRLILAMAVGAVVAVSTLGVLPVGWNVIVAALAGGVVNAALRDSRA